MKISYIELLGQKYPMCFSLTASEELDEHFGGLENMEAELHCGKLARVARAVDTILTVLMKHGRIYAESIGEDVPAPIKCRPGDLIDVTDENALKTVFSVIQEDTKREVEVETKNTEATQGR